METNKENISKRPFLEKLATFDLERYYTPWVRFFCHFSMWVFFTSLIQLHLFFDSGLPFDQAAAFALRTLFCNLAVFYLFFYVAVPNTLLKSRIIATLLSFGGCVFLWNLLNHYFILFIGNHFNVTAPYYGEGVQNSRALSFWFIISPKFILLSLIPMFYAISPFFFTKIVFSIIRFYSQAFKSERRVMKLERDFLKAQLNPHFLFNTLNRIYALLLRKDDRAPQTITQLSEMMRYTLYESDAQLVPVEKELDYIQNYVKLERTRYRQNANIVCQIDDLQVDGQLIAPLLTFTFVENAFKYGLKKKNEGFVKMHISVADGVFNFSILNDKDEKQKSTEFGGIGLANVNKRLELLYPGNHELIIEDRGHSFYVGLAIKLQKTTTIE